MLIKLKNVYKTYKLESFQINALEDVSLQIDKGEFISITGPSGSGKSTLMHVIGLLDQPTSGEFLFEDRDVGRLSDSEAARIRNERVGFIFQSFNLLPKIPSIENVKLPAFYSKNKIDLDGRAKDLLEKVGLSDRLFNKPSQLSGGQQQRVAIARALMNDPQIIFADEPTGNLDTKSGKEIIDLLESLNKEGRTVVIVTHERELAEATKRKIVLKDGRIIEDTKK